MPKQVDKGYKSSELYVVIAVLLPWVCQQLGLDFNAVANNAEELRAAIEQAHGNSDMPVWLAGIYIAGRKLLKWKAQ